ncbi:hypothetical protein OIDMADRAFT_177610 [Oidiodendron maius Zn]|uniref:Uncharacterized protein n=1 Tax=Oidiodendron maius (strain Zn) TaxID=913774 RepID=A0A0C3HLW2_OIDMZ|nr:hypothetical protein OIDMADRAFT_177610 [Oidiodendron maius Zn]
MKYTTAAALLSLASAANLSYEISDFSAACTPGSTNCLYELTIATSNNPEFKESCEAIGASNNGELPAVGATQCGTYTISVAKSDNGGLVLTVNSVTESLTGTFTISSDDLTTTTSGASTVQSYTGDSAFTIDIQNASSTSASTSGTTASVSGTTASASGTTASTLTASSASSASSSASSVSPTAASTPSTTGTTTSSSASPSKTNGATRESAFAGVLFAIGLMACTL